MNKSEILNTMKLLGIKEVTSNRQALNGTREFELPIKYPWGINIRVASFKTGYVRNQNGASSNYQLNKCKMSKRYYKYSDGKTHEFDHKLRILIPSEKDRLKYLLYYCIKNYYIGHANLVANGEFIPKWKHEDELQYARKLEDKVCNPEVKVIVNGQRYNVI
tara:strand:+ start:1511 stop:1996 length:486 start_codon:yes stop_codon:yes gene_type:complete